MILYDSNILKIMIVGIFRAFYVLGNYMAIYKYYF